MDSEVSNLVHSIGVVLIIIITVTLLLTFLKVDVVEMITNFLSNRQLKM